LGWVLLGHVLLFLFIWIRFPDFSLKKILDIKVELQPSQQRVAGAEKPSVPPASAVMERDVVKPNQDMGQSTVTPSSASPSTSSVAPQESRLVVPSMDIDLNAAYLDNPKPPYPPLAYRMRVEGRVILDVEVLETGLVGGAQLFQTSGSELLDQSALETVKKWRFRPAVKEGVIRRQWVKVPIHFHLNKR
jgi:protein TonB